MKNSTRPSILGTMKKSMAFSAVLLAGAAAAPTLDYNPEHGNISFGAGAMTYIAQVSPSTGPSIDARYEYRLIPRLAVEGSGTTAFSRSVQGGGTTVPILLEGGLKMRSLPASGNVGFFGAADLGYGAFLGTDHLQDGATFTTPLSLGAEWQGRHFGLAPRFTYRPVFGDQLGPDNASADSWTAVLDVQLPVL